jgi:hypothetical protein
MKADIKAALTELPALSPSNRRLVPCKICGSRAYVFDVVDFNKACSPDIYLYGTSGILVPYHRCLECQFLFTDFFDDWSRGDFAQFIYNHDYVKVDAEYAGARPERDAQTMARLLKNFPPLRILDYGSGSGLLAEHLRSEGFTEVAGYDPFSNPARPAGQFDLISCFETLEHSTSPHATLVDIVSLLKPSGCVVFSTGIQPPTIDELRANWWYVAPRNGHVSIYSLNSLALLGNASGLTLYVGPGGTAYAGSQLSASSRQILLSIGQAVQFFQLYAPDEGDAVPVEQLSSWHGVENDLGSTFRWTRESTIAWRLQGHDIQPGQLTLALSALDEVQSGFAEACHLEIGRQKAPLVRQDGVLSAVFSISEPTTAVATLVMPPHLRPCDLRPVGDSRVLGLAIALR